jgi:hypothetical protein
MTDRPVPSSLTVAGTDDPTPAETTKALLAAVRTGADTTGLRSQLAGYDDDALRTVRESRATALAFWTNLYNAGTQLLLTERPELYDTPLRSVRFFRATAVTVAGTDLSLDDVEMGLLRGRSKYGLGYVPRILPGAFERRYRLTEPDPRVHFALNCGAASCPPVRAYEADRVDGQLDLATRSYLDATVEYDPEADVLRVPRVFLWFRGDFGGGSGLRSFLREHDALASDADPTVRYLPWDWSKAIGRYVDPA